MTKEAAELLLTPEDLIPKRCAGCLPAMEVAIELCNEQLNGDKSTDQIQREFDLKMGGHCLLGLTELSEDAYCFGVSARVPLPVHPQ